MKDSIRPNFINTIIYFYISIFIFLLLYTFYRAEIIHGGNQLLYYYKYYLIFIFFIILWFLILFFLNKKNKSILIIIASTLFFLLYFYETINFYSPTLLKISFIKSLNKEALKKSQLGEKSKQDIINELKISKGLDVVPSIFPKIFLKKNIIDSSDKNIFPLGGVSNTTTVFCKEGKEYSIYMSDRYGFNNPDNEWNNNEIVWLLIGDSFAQGSCVKQDENFAGQIRLITKESAISLGMSGNGPLIELASLKEYGYKKKPKIVLWFYFERNDLDDLRFEKHNSFLLQYLNKDFNQNLYEKQKVIDKKLKQHIQIAESKLEQETTETHEYKDKFLSIKKIIRLQIVRDKMALDRGLDYGIDPLFKKIMIDAKKFVNQWNGELYFIYLPDKERYSNNKIKDDKYLNRSKIINIIKKLNIPIIDIHKEFFIKEKDPVSFFAYRIFGHYSPDGYHEISKVIIKKIKEERLNN